MPNRVLPKHNLYRMILIKILKGQFFQMELVHNPSALNDSKQAEECMSLDLHGRPTTMAKHMERKGRSKDGTTEGVNMGLNPKFLFF